MSMQFKLVDNSDLVKKALPEVKEKALEAVGLQVEGHAINELSNNPKRIDTGLLKNSITHAVSGKPAAKSSYVADTPKEGKAQNSGSYSGQAPDEAQKAVWIGTNVEYAIYVHEGTSKMKPNRFIKNAIVRNKKEIADICETYLKNG